MQYPETHTSVLDRARPSDGSDARTPFGPTGAPPAAGARAASRARGGFTLLEVMIAAVIFMIALGGIITALLTSSALVDANRETVLAYHGAQSALESMRGVVDYQEIFVRFNADTADDPPDPTIPSPGHLFAVRGLDPRPGDLDGFVGEIFFPVVGTILREDVLDQGFGTPRDLTGDGVVDGADHSLDYRMLPVRVRVQWTGKGGDRELEFAAVLADI